MGERQDRPRWVAKKRRVTTATVYFGLLFKPPPPATSSHAQRPPFTTRLLTVCYCLIDHILHKLSLPHLSLFALPTDRPQPRSASNLLHNRIQSFRCVRARGDLTSLIFANTIEINPIPFYFQQSQLSSHFEMRMEC